ncbi:hypothetical protein HMPREF1544_09954 [Mucor circinelloides 1006PhL]|uniref:Uncharacterized protein n=1 Tax=Mucor circinelloides f. circinelloides (strain 1006PhL) TaxID=1220926 RepID=S2JL96_MUCC1|nr:hypothetical protein HMPREF1544_09954 [Mucor circinelloides 1006PhL]
MGFAADSVNEYDLKFIPGEYILMASKETNKVDACIIDNGMEICLLETSGKLLLRDNNKYGFDHIKCNFGSLNIFNNIYKKYYWASQETAGRLKIPFVNARHGTIHLWSLELCSPKLYCSKKVFKCVVPKAMSETNDILALGNVCWCLTSALRDAAKTIQAMKNEHNQYEIERVLSGSDNRVPLNQLVNSDTKKPTEGCGFGILIPEEKEEAEFSICFKAPN